MALSAAACAVLASGGSGNDATARGRNGRVCVEVYAAPSRPTPAVGAATTAFSAAVLHRVDVDCRGRRARGRVFPSAFALAAARGIAELAGLGGDRSPAAWEAQRGLWWAHNGRAHWWESALALRTLVRYLELTRNTDPRFQHLILATYRRNVLTPQALATTNFVNKFWDDTAWWGLAWLEAAKYELHDQHDATDADTFLREAEWDATTIEDAPTMCGGIEWAEGFPPDTVANAEYAALATGLYGFLHAPGVFQDPATASQWLAQARARLGWLVKVRLVDVRTGTVWDTLGRNCKRQRGPVTYTEGEVAEAFTDIGIALHDRADLRKANAFLRYVIHGRSEMVRDGVLVERCESLKGGCENAVWPVNIPAYKGIFVQAVSDWSRATRSDRYRGFLLAQGASILQHDISYGGDHQGDCGTPHTCQFGFHWAGPLMRRHTRLAVSAASQASALDALTAVLASKS